MKRIYVVNVIQPLFKMMLLPDDEDITYFTSEGDHTGRASNDHNNKKRELLACIHLQSYETLIDNDKIWFQICKYNSTFIYKPTDKSNIY